MAPAQVDTLRAEVERNRASAENAARLDELLEAELAPFATVTRLLVAAERGVEVGASTVDVHVPVRMRLATATSSWSPEM